MDTIYIVTYLDKTCRKWVSFCIKGVSMELAFKEAKGLIGQETSVAIEK